MSTKKGRPASFADLELSQALQQVASELGYQHLTPIQALSIPPLLAGKDVVGQAQTGSGKTAAFSLPILQDIDLRGRRLQALILCPTRELSTQVAREIRKFGRRCPGLQVLVVSGGMPPSPQRSALAKGVHIVVGTPGRALDLINREHLDLGRIRWLVLDEADRMLDMGFLEDIEAILKATPKSRQTAFFSATFPDTIERVIATHQRTPVRIKIEGDPEDRAVAEILQSVYETSRENKVGKLQDLIAQHKPASAIVFCNHKATVGEVTTVLNEAGFSAAALHGGLEQRDRDRVLAKFRNQSIRILVATDVAARGLDVERLDIVFNYDLPFKPETYIHRIGRTGRAGRGGVAISLVTPADRARLASIEEGPAGKIARNKAPPHKPHTATPAAATPRDAAMETLYISGGRKDKLRPGDILGALTGEAAGLGAADIGKIEIHDHFAYVAVAKSAVQAALAGLRNGKIKGRKFQVELVR